MEWEAGDTTSGQEAEGDGRKRAEAFTVVSIGRKAWGTVSSLEMSWNSCSSLGPKRHPLLPGVRAQWWQQVGVSEHKMPLKELAS